MDPTDDIPRQNRELRRYLRDLAALAGLPAMWRRADRRYVVESLAEVLVKILQADLVAVRLRAPAGTRPIEARAGRPGVDLAEKYGAIRRTLEGWLASSTATAELAAPLAVKDDAVQAAVAPIGEGCEFGVLAAVSARPGFPQEGDRLLLSVAASQAAVAFQHQRADETQALLSAIVESSTEAIVSKTLEGIITSWNAAAERLFGYAAEEAVGQPITLVIPPDRYDEEQSILARIRRGERILPYETIRRAKGGRLVHVSLTISPIRDGAGRIVGASKIAHDVSGRQDAARRRDAFLAMLAHELRNPLAPIRNAVQVLRARAPLPDELQWAVDVIDRQTEQMSRLVDDLLDVSRFTRDTIGLRKETVELGAVVSSALDASRPLIEERRHQLTVTMPSTPVRLEADPVRLAQILANLLNNAAKYTDAGGSIWLSAERAGDDVVIRVRDTGIGITADMLPRVFDMFCQAERSIGRSHGGLGVGLTLVKRLVEMHGGAVSASSAGAGKGSEFVVRLPLGAGAAAPVAAPVAAPDQGADPGADPPRPAGTCRILVVDDNFDATESLAVLLRMSGHEVFTAHDGGEAVAAAAALRPDVVVLDIGLPTLNGYEAARRIREQPGGAEMVLIALTGWGQDDDRRRSQEAGFDHHLTKPVDFDALQHFLVRRVPCAAPAARR